MGRSGFLVGAGVTIATTFADYFVNEKEANLQNDNKKQLKKISRTTSNSSKSIISQEK